MPQIFQNINNAIKVPDKTDSSDHAAVITHETAIKELAELNEISKIQIEGYTYQKREEVDYLLQSLFRQGILDIIGSSYVLDRAKMSGMQGHLIWSLSGVRSAIQSAIVIAQCIHNESARHSERFVTVDCASISTVSFEILMRSVNCR